MELRGKFKIMYKDVAVVKDMTATKGMLKTMPKTDEKGGLRAIQDPKIPPPSQAQGSEIEILLRRD